MTFNAKVWAVLLCNNILQNILLNNETSFASKWHIAQRCKLQLIPSQPLPGRQLQVSGRTMPSKMTFKATGHLVRVCFQTQSCQPGHSETLSPGGSSPGYFYVVFPSKHCFSKKPTAQVHWVLAKECSCSEEHVSHEVTFAQDRVLTSAPLRPASPSLGPCLW